MYKHEGFYLSYCSYDALGCSRFYCRCVDYSINTVMYLLFQTRKRLRYYWLNSRYIGPRGAPTQHTKQPIVTGTSVLGIKVRVDRIFFRLVTRMLACLTSAYLSCANSTKTGSCWPQTPLLLTARSRCSRCLVHSGNLVRMYSAMLSSALSAISARLLLPFSCT